MKGGRRQIAGVDAPVLTGKTQQLSVRIEGDAINVSFDERREAVRLGPKVNSPRVPGSLDH